MKHLVAGIVGLNLLGGGLLASAAPIVLNPVAHDEVGQTITYDSGTDTHTYGPVTIGHDAVDDLANYREDYGNYQVISKFDLTGLSAANVDSATFHFYGHALYGVYNSLRVTLISTSDYSTLLASDFSAVNANEIAVVLGTGTAENHQYDVDLTAAVKNAINNGQGLAFRIEDTIGGNYAGGANVTPSDVSVSIEAVPEPTIMGLAAVGSLVLLRRRRA